jgi:transposase-like protein
MTLFGVFGCSPFVAWHTAGAVMADASLNRRQTIRVGAGVAFAQVGIVGFDGQIELEALRLCGLPEAAPAVLYACPSVPIGTRSLALETGGAGPGRRRDGEESIAALCRREAIAESLYYAWPKEFLEAGKRRLAGDTARAATSDEVQALRHEARALKEVVAEQALELRLLKKSMIAAGDGLT